MEPGWEAFLTERDRAVFAASGYGARAGFGRRPVVVVVDVTYNFCGDRPEPILESITRWRRSCGAEAWDAIPHIATLVAAARALGVPVVFTTGVDYRQDRFDAGRWDDKNARAGVDPEPAGVGNQVVAEVAPAEGDLVVAKAKPSAFFGTQLASHLVSLGADSLIVCGTTTSGCVRATVVDAFSYNYRVSIVAEGTFDRGQASHAVNLFDMAQKYADVVGLDEVLAHLGEVGTPAHDGVPAGG
ncbi:MAG TPA: isochorismatase family protein [Acidimicrobiales bacterium]|nr:isochorismatase family protein [Acidimicrobiales bacterium]